MCTAGFSWMLKPAELFKPDPVIRLLIFSIFSQFQNFIILEIGFAGFAVLESRYEKRAVYSLTLKGHLHFERPSIVKGYWLSAMFWLNIVHSFSAGGNDAVSETISWLTG